MIIKWSAPVCPIEYGKAIRFCKTFCDVTKPASSL